MFESRFVCNSCSVYVFAVVARACSDAEVAVANVVEQVLRVVVHVACASVLASATHPAAAGQALAGHRVVAV